MSALCGAPRPEGFGEWAGCLLFHNYVHLSLTGTLGLVLIGYYLGTWLRRRQIVRDVEAYVASWGNDHTPNFAEGMAFAAYLARRGHRRRPKPKVDV